MKAIGIILAGGNNDGRLGVLTDHRAAAALPIGSCYRAIDFTLSNMSNSGIGKVAVLTQYNSRSLRDHLMSSKWWDFGRKQGGLFVFTPYTSNAGSTWFRGTADSIYQNMTFLKRSNEEYVVITSGDSVYKMDYRKVLEYHKESSTSPAPKEKAPASKYLSLKARNATARPYTVLLPPKSRNRTMNRNKSPLRKRALRTPLPSTRP